MTRRAARHPTSIAAEYGVRLSRRISVALLAILGVLWVSGIFWLLLHYVFAVSGEFGVVRHPLETPTVSVHGVFALLALFVLGWFTGRHANLAASRRRRLSGWLLIALLGVLVVSGCAQFFLTSEAWQSGVAIAHEVAGVALLLPVLVHGRRSNAATRDRDHVHVHRREHDRRHAVPAPRSARS